MSRGKAIWRGESAYEQARVDRLFNAIHPDRYPAGIILASSIDDVIVAVRLANQRNLKISIRAGGHSWVSSSLRDEALLIDLGRLKEISLDRDTGIVAASPAVTGGDLNSYLAQFDLFFPGGHCPEVGLGGFLLQGGMGWNARGWGWACLYVDAIDVVTADGRLLHADANENSEFFWAARGAGPGYFAIVVRFYLKPRAMPKALTRSTVVFPVESYDVVMPWLHETHSTISPTVDLVVAGVRGPAQSAGPSHSGGPSHSAEDDQHSILINAISLAQTPDEARAALNFIETCPARAEALSRELNVPITMREINERERQANPPGNRYAADNVWLNSWPVREVTAAMKQCFTALPTKHTFVLWSSMAPLPKALPDMALSLYSEIYFVLYPIWSDPADDAKCREWLANQMERLAPLGEGSYLGDLDLLTRPAEFMAPENFAKLQQLRAKYDPQQRICSYLARENAPLNGHS
jgi:FAD/FMN-containing dehydrogenase